RSLALLSGPHKANRVPREGSQKPGTFLAKTANDGWIALHSFLAPRGVAHEVDTSVSALFGAAPGPDSSEYLLRFPRGVGRARSGRDRSVAPAADAGPAAARRRSFRNLDNAADAPGRGHRPGTAGVGLLPGVGTGPDQRHVAHARLHPRG